jgi:hypothetical protein
MDTPKTEGIRRRRERRRWREEEYEGEGGGGEEKGEDTENGVENW